MSQTPGVGRVDYAPDYQSDQPALPTLPTSIPVEAPGVTRKPGLGSQVLYRQHGSPNGLHKPAQVPAMVNYVYPEGDGMSVDLYIMNRRGTFHGERIIYDPNSGPGTWCWPDQP